MRTFYFSVKEGTAASFNIDFTPPQGTLAARAIATNASGSTQTLSGGASVSGNKLVLNVPSSYAVSANFPAVFQVQIQVDGGPWYTVVEGHAAFVAKSATQVETEQVTTLSSQVSALSTQVSSLESKPALGLPIFTYGNSYALLGGAWYTAGNQWTQKLQSKIGSPTLTSYAISGTRIIDVCGGLNGSAYVGSAGQTTGALWPGTSSRKGLVILESIINDIGHYPSHSGTAIPAAISSANTQYIDMLKGMYRQALAQMSASSTRVEQTAATFTGTWGNTNFATNGASGLSVAYTTTNSAKAAFANVTPPQSGPLAGKVFLSLIKLGGAFVNSQITIDVDGANSFTYTPTLWEAYTGQVGNVQYGPDCIAISVPVDGAAHTINVTHTGTTGQYLYVDSIIVPSATPNPILVMGGENPPTTGVWTAAQVGVWKANAAKVIPVVKSIVAEFPNAIYVPSTMTTNGLYSGDGLHPNDRGMEQRSNDAYEAVKFLIAKFKNLTLEAQPDSNFAKV